MKSRRRKLYFLLLAVAITAPSLVYLIRRRDVTDPAIIARMRPEDLRESEVSRLVLAAIQSSTTLEIQSEVEDPSGKYRVVRVASPAELARLATSWADGRTIENAPSFYLPYPGMEYVRLSFNGPYRPKLSFHGVREAWVGPGHMPRVRVSDAFTRDVAAILQLQAPPAP